jgi:hypothetical protein
MRIGLKTQESTANTRSAALRAGFGHEESFGGHKQNIPEGTLGILIFVTSFSFVPFVFRRFLPRHRTLPRTHDFERCSRLLRQMI